MGMVEDLVVWEASVTMLPAQLESNKSHYNYYCVMYGHVIIT